MKKIIIVAIALMLVTGFAFSQEQDPGFSNTVYTNVGTTNMKEFSDKVGFEGFVDYFTANVTVGGLTIAGDIAWSILEGGTSFSTSYIDHNFNAVMTPFANFNFGIGTNLDWNVGPKPFSGPSYSAYEVPEYAGLGYTDLVKNHFADDALAARYTFEDLLVVGFGLNNGASGNNGTGIGIEANLLDAFSIGFAYNGSFSESNSNIYLGSSIYAIKGFDIDIWTNFDVKKSTSIGGRVAFYKDAFRLAPEATVTVWSTGLSFYVAAIAEMSITDTMLAGINASFGMGDDSTFNTSRLNVSPHFVWNISKTQRLAVALNIVAAGNSVTDNSTVYWGIPISWRVLF